MAALRSLFVPMDRINPYQDLLARHLSSLGGKVAMVRGSVFLPALLRWKPHILHLHWLHYFFLAQGLTKSLIKSVAFLAQLCLARLLGVKIVWTAHNLVNHERQRETLDRFFRGVVARFADAIIVHGASAGPAVAARCRIKDLRSFAVVPHGNYVDVYPNTQSRSTARGELGLAEDVPVMLFLGGIRPYKGVLRLVRSFKRMDPSGGSVLLIVGPAYDRGLMARIQAEIDSQRGIRFLPGFVEPERIQTFMNAADLVVLPHREILTSGALVLAMSFGKPVIAPRLGCIPDMVDEQGSFFYDPDVEDGLLGAMLNAVEAIDRFPRMGAHNLERARQWGWQRVAGMTLDVYRRALRR